MTTTTTTSQAASPTTTTTNPAIKNRISARVRDNQARVRDCLFTISRKPRHLLAAQPACTLDEAAQSEHPAAVLLFCAGRVLDMLGAAGFNFGLDRQGYEFVTMQLSALGANAAGKWRVATLALEPTDRDGHGRVSLELHGRGMTRCRRVGKTVGECFRRAGLATEMNDSSASGE